MTGPRHPIEPTPAERRPTRRYLVTIHDVGNITDDPRNVHTILTSRDFIAPRDRVEVVAYDEPDTP